MSTLHMSIEKWMDISKILNVLKSRHIANIGRYDLVMCACYYDHCMVAFCNLLKKTSFIFDKVYDFYS
jgi:hypothetical protein